jgi:hypothetical protein
LTDVGQSGATEIIRDDGLHFGGDLGLTFESSLIEREGAAYLAIEFIGVENDVTASEIRVETLGDGGASSVVETIPGWIGFRERLIPIEAGSTVRLTSDRPQVLKYAGLLHPLPHDVTSTIAPLEAAIVTGPLRGDGETLTNTAQPWLIAPGEVLTLRYNAPNRTEDTARDWVVALEAQSTGASATELSTMRPMPRDDSRPLEFALRQNQPNPYAEATTVRFDLPFSAYVELEVFDTQGRRVRTLVREDRGPGYHAVNWNNRDDVGNRVRPGVYLYRIKAGTFASERKMVVKP